MRKITDMTLDLRRVTTVLLMVAALGLATLARAEEDGQADLDEALRAKVTAEDLRDINHVVDLLESALDKGLDVENSDFAESVLCESLLERATQLTNVLDHVPPEDLIDPRMAQVRDLATSDLRRVLTYDSAPPQATAMLAELLTMPGGDRREARRLLDKLFKHPEIATLDPQDRAEALVLRASLQTTPAKAIADYDAAVELTPKSAAVLLARAGYYDEQDKLDKALADIAAVIEAHPDKPEPYLLRAQIERKQKKNDDAIKSLAKAAELAPAAAAPYQTRGEIFRDNGDFGKAIEQFTKVLELQPGNLLALLHRAESYLSQKQFDLALVDVDVVLKTQPGLVVAHALRAQVLASLKRLPEAISEMEQLADALPKQTEYRMQLALYYLVAEQPHKAIQAYTDVLEQEADSFDALRMRGDAYLNVGDHEAAAKDFEKALTLSDKDTSLLNNYAWLLATSPIDSVRDGKKAIDLATKAADLTKHEKPHILSTLAAAYAESGDFETARKWSKQSIETRDEESSEAETKEMGEQLKKELASYEANKPWRERQTASDKSSSSEESKPSTDGAAKPAEAGAVTPPDSTTSQSE